jgi:hypothetical protein
VTLHITKVGCYKKLFYTNIEKVCTNTKFAHVVHVMRTGACTLSHLPINIMPIELHLSYFLLYGSSSSSSPISSSPVGLFQQASLSQNFPSLLARGPWFRLLPHGASEAAVEPAHSAPSRQLVRQLARRPWHSSPGAACATACVACLWQPRLGPSVAPA